MEYGDGQQFLYLRLKIRKKNIKIDHFHALEKIRTDLLGIL